MNEIPWYKLLTKSNNSLKIDNPGIVRMGCVGHPLPMSRNWVRTVGLWGGQYTAATISKLVGKNPRAVRSYAQTKSLTLATRNNPSITQAAVALRAYSYWLAIAEGAREMGIFDVARIALASGIYPVEALYYARAIPALEDLTEQSVNELAEYENEELQELWLQAKLRLYFPETPDDEASLPAEVTELFHTTLQ